MYKRLFLVPLLLLGRLGHAQAPVDSTQAPSAASPFSWYAYADAYYGFDPANAGHRRPEFVFSHHHANQIAINNAVLGGRYQGPRIRAAVGLHAGTYVTANYASEPAALRAIYEAYLGLHHGQAWLDVGIFGSHIGFETALSKDNWTLTRSLMADGVPYYETGARLTWEATPSITVTLLALNGWQNIRDQNGQKAGGWQVQWKPNARWLFNSSSFYGNEQPTDSARRRRFFHDCYATYELTPKLALAAAWDIGVQQRPTGEPGRDLWHSGAAFARYHLARRWTTALRAEYYKATRGVIIGSPAPMLTADDVFLRGGSLNLDYAPTTYATVRVEGRVVNSTSALFVDRTARQRHAYSSLTSSIAIAF